MIRQTIREAWYNQEGEGNKKRRKEGREEEKKRRKERRKEGRRKEGTEGGEKEDDQSGGANEEKTGCNASRRNGVRPRARTVSFGKRAVPCAMLYRRYVWTLADGLENKGWIENRVGKRSKSIATVRGWSNRSIRFLAGRSFVHTFIDDALLAHLLAIAISTVCNYIFIRTNVILLPRDIIFVGRLNTKWKIVRKE